uniref:Zona occludens protein 1 n=1 Tax=Sinocyclocheilus grahami TaxID=75366 RepID=A0A672NE18_SINGR
TAFSLSLSQSTTMEETVIWEQHTVTLLRAPGFGFGIAISGGRDNPHFQSGETSIVISDVLKGGPAEGLLQENDRVVMVNAVAMDNVEHAYAVQQLRKSGKNAKITIRRKRKVQIPVSRGGDRETMSEREEEDDTEEDDYEGPARAGGASGGTSRRNERSGSAGRRDHSNSRERSISPHSDRRSVASNVPARPSKVTLVKSRKNEEYGLRLASHIFVKDISSESLAARDGNIQEGDVVLKINGTVTENLSLIDAKKLIERSKGKLKMVVQRDERATLLNIPDLDNSIPSANSDRDDISEIHSMASDHSHERTRRSRSHSPDKRSEPSDISSNSPQQMSNGSKQRTLLKGSLTFPFPCNSDHVIKTVAHTCVSNSNVCLEPKPVYAQPGQPDVDLPVSPSDAPVPSVTHDDSILRPSMKLVKFKKGESVGLRLAGGNDVGIFVAGVLEDSPAAKEGLEEGDQILRVNNVDFANIIREEAVLFLLDLPRGEEVTILAQRKKDVYRRIVESDVGDSFYIRTHFEYEKESPYGLSFNKGEVFRVVDTLYNGKLGSWLAIRIGKNHQEVERGIIPNKNRAEQLSSVQYTLPKTAGGDRADFWRFRGLRSSKRNLRKSREDLSAQTVQTKFPAYERVVLREAGFLRPVVIFGPIADVARDKLAREVPDLFELAKSEPRDAGTDQHIMQCVFVCVVQDKHAVLDITPNAVDRLNYAQWYPIVVFLNPDSKQGVKNMRTRLCPESKKSARKLHERALKLRKNNHHLFTATINMNSMNDGWYGALKEIIQQQQNQLVWVSEGKADGAPDDDLDLHDDRLSYVSAPGSEYSMYSTDSRHTSDYEDTDTEGGAYTDQELDETLNDEVGPPIEPAITRSSEPVREDPPVIQEPPGYRVYQPEPLNRIDPAGFKAPAPQQKAEAALPTQPEPLAETAPPAVLVNVGALSGKDLPVSLTQGDFSPEAGSLFPPAPELAQPPSLDPNQSGQPGSESKMYKKDIYRNNEPVQVSQNPMQPNYNPQQPLYQEDKPYRDYDHQPYHYDGGYMEPKARNFDPHLNFDSSVPPYDEQWAPYDQTAGYDPHMPYEDGLNRMYGHPQMRHDTGYDASRPRYGKPSPGPIRHDELPPVHPQYDQEALPRTQASSRSPEPPKQQYTDPSQRPSYTQPPKRGYNNSEASATPAKPESISPPVEPALPPPPAEAEDDPALKHQSVLTRVKMFENKRSVSVDRARESADSGIRVTFKVLLSSVRSPEPQQPQPKAADIIRSNNNDPDEDEEYYRKQLSFFDRRSFDSKPSAQPTPAIKPAQPQTQPGYYPRYVSTKQEFVKKNVGGFRYKLPYLYIQYVYSHTLSHTVTPPLVSHGSPKVKPPNHKDTVQSTCLPQKSFPEKSPVNGTGEPPKINSTATSSYNRFVPKPYITSARPFEHKFDSPKFNHNLLPNDSQNKTDNVKAPISTTTKPQSSPQPTDHDSGLDTFTRTMDQKPKYQQNNINAVPKAIPVSPSALEDDDDDDDDDSHTVVATARGIFNSNGGVLSSIETGVSIIIPQGAIPESVEQEIYFKVCRDNSILPPLDKEKGETLLSPLVMCGPHGLKFLKPVELRLPHCASMTPDGDPKSWQNNSLPGDPNYLVGANCVSVLIDHF